jgi:RHS repeat-associated protein
VINTLGIDASSYVDPYPGPFVGPFCNNPRITGTTTILPPTNQQSQVTYSYGDFGNIADKYEYDWGVGGPGALLRQTDYQYLHNSNPGAYGDLAAHILDRPSVVTTIGADGNYKAQTINSYDNTGILDDLGGAPQHDGNYSTAYYARGNLTQVQRWLYPGNTYITTATNYYDDLGNLRQTTDGNNNSTYFDYSDDFADWSCLIQYSAPQAWVTQTTNALGQSTQTQYYPCTGLPVWHRDQNDINANRVNASYAYDSMNRVTSVSYADSGNSSYGYQDTPSFNAPYVYQTDAIDGSNSTSTWTQVDGLGRVIRTAKANGEGSVDDVDTCYDALGRKSFVTYPYQGPGWQPGTYHCPPDAATPLGDSFTYDALGRTTRVTHADNSHVDTDYSQFPRVMVTDEAGKQRLNQADALGRLIAVWEPDSNGNLNWYTGYQYDTLDNLVFANQIGGDPNNARQRFFQYDSLSRLISATNPESGTITYGYDNAGNLTSKTAPAPNQQDPNVTITTYFSYDALNRLTSKGFSDSSSGTGFVYDQTPLWGVTVQNPVGRLVGSYVWTNGVSGSVGSVLSYDAMGRTNYENHFNGHAATWLNEIFNYAYNLDGSLKTVQYPTGRTITYGYNVAQRPVSAQDLDNNIKYVTNAHYTASGALSSLVNGSTPTFAGITTSNSYNSRMQPVFLSASSPGGAIFNLGYDFHLGSNDNGNVYAVNNNKILDHGRDQSFTYDQLNRLTSAQSAATSGPNCWGESYGYDPWGNLNNRNVTKCTGEGALPTANNKNQMAGYNYDAAGNLWMWGWHYDDENRLVAAPLANLTFDYDPQGRRVEKSNGTLYWYDIGGNVLEETNLNGGLKAEYVFFNGKHIARVDTPPPPPPCTTPPRCPLPPVLAPSVYYYFADQLGSTDVLTDAFGNVVEESEYYPFGGERGIIDTGIGNSYKFTGKERDPEDGLDNFGARYYTWYFSRFTTPDWATKPTAVPYANFGNPQSLNLYSYVKNNPTTFGDPDGHCPGDDCNKITVTAEVSEEPHVTGWKTQSHDNGNYDHAEASGMVNYTFQYDSKPLINTMIHEDVKARMFDNGTRVPGNSGTGDHETDQHGVVQDDVRVGVSTRSRSDSGNAALNHMTTSAVRENVTQVLTFKSPTGCACSVTERRTVTNVTGQGQASATFSIKLTSPLVQTATPVKEAPRTTKPAVDKWRGD